MPDTDRTREAIEVSDMLAHAVREAGELALSKFRTPFKTWTKDKSSPVTEVDIAVNEMLRARLSAHTPDHAWLSEETVDDRERVASRRVWVVDPIDGTRAFIAGFPDWTIVAALVEDGRPIAAAMFAPVTDELFVAASGAGASLNGERLHASGGAALEGARFGGPKGRLDLLAALGPRIEVAPKIHSLALRIARVATGALDAAFAAPNSHDWDLAAADLLVHEAGGLLTTLEGRSPTYNRPDPIHGALIAAGRARHATLIDLMRDREAEFA